MVDRVMMQASRRRLFTPRAVVSLILALAGLVYLMPVYVMVSNGLKDAQSVGVSTMWVPAINFQGTGFLEAWHRLSPNMLNSLLIVVPAAVISSAVGSLNGYILSKWRFPGADILFVVMLFGFFIPYQSILIPLIKFLQVIGLYGSIGGLIVVHVAYGLPVTTLIFRNYFANVPNEILESARMDGAGVFGAFVQILLPLSLPAFVVSLIFQFTSIWNDFLFGVTIVPNPRFQPVTVALNNLSGTFSVDWNVVMAGAVIAALPTALIYLLLGRYFVQGLLAGSVRG
jgi:glucose/mannose transport system permease protein